MIAELAEGILRQDHRALAKGITLVESFLPKHRLQAEELFAAILGRAKPGRRIGVAGPPGVGKSTLIAEFACWLLDREADSSVAVIAIDPSSPIHGGSILGDKSRMARLCGYDRAFIRPSPSGSEVGGVARRSYEVLLLLEAAGFSHIFMETVGIGQNEANVAKLVDCLLLVQMPATGDEIQALKKGVIELADLIVINKADGLLKASAKLLYEQIKSIQNLASPTSTTKDVILCSSLEKSGFVDIHSALSAFFARQHNTERFGANRDLQAKYWLQHELSLQFSEALGSEPYRSQLQDFYRSVQDKRETIHSAASRALSLLTKPGFK